ncbi:MAG: signal peptidase I [Thermodesulfobacteriota bacterium]
MKKKSVLREYSEAIIIALVLALFIRTFVIQAFKIPSGSMLPTLQIGDHILVNKFFYGLRNPFNGTVLIPIATPKKKDIIVFKYPENPDIDYIKRVVGTAGDRIEIKDKVLYVNGEPLSLDQAIHNDPDILPGKQSPRDNFGPITVPSHSLFVMGDNRDNSHDSRFWKFVPAKAVLGKAFIIYWSWDTRLDLFSFQRLASIRWSRLGDTVHQ